MESETSSECMEQSEKEGMSNVLLVLLGLMASGGEPRLGMMKRSRKRGVADRLDI